MVSMELSPLLLRTVIDKVSTILLSPKYTDTDTFPLPMSALIRSESTEQRLHFISVNTCRKAADVSVTHYITTQQRSVTVTLSLEG